MAPRVRRSETNPGIASYGMAMPKGKGAMALDAVLVVKD